MAGHIVSIIGARPQFVKAAALSPVLRRTFKETLVHTGQHYDYDMSRIFFEELSIPEPDHHLEVGSGSHGWQTGQMLEKIEKVLLQTMPDWVLVYGDTNSTLAAALAASKLHIPVGHVEAGLRSYNRKMPEEINRVLSDHVSAILFCPTRTAVNCLAKEGITEGVHLTGDVMKDLLESCQERISANGKTLASLGLEQGSYLYMTLHRAENTESSEKLADFLAELDRRGQQVAFPVHPRTRPLLSDLETRLRNIRLLAPVGYLTSLTLTRHARAVLTDSGGLQKEAYLLGVPCLTLRKETEWPETLHDGWNCLVGLDSAPLFSGLAQSPTQPRNSPFGDGHACEKIVQALESVS
ncbi:MAG: UDP-N-acetylglucosamine 2-epimerase (non-hydrolyzing) [Armatimonadetes bacterium]|nr:UDP-N-acetylglucosamine 2-epimerase (non-hydrolyzing) [Armatimonadota bacterium]